MLLEAIHTWPTSGFEQAGTRLGLASQWYPMVLPTLYVRGLAPRVWHKQPTTIIHVLRPDGNSITRLDEWASRWAHGARLTRP